MYLNTAEKDFQGGTFRFKRNEQQEDDEKEMKVVAAPGRVVIYDASEVHCVDEVLAGERFTLAMWFTASDPQFDEDVKILNTIWTLGVKKDDSLLPAALHALPEDDTDIRLCRLACCGFGFARVAVQAEGPSPSSPDFQILRKLEDEDWEDSNQIFHIVVRSSGGGGDNLVVGSVPLHISLRQAVIGLQWGLSHRHKLSSSSCEVFEFGTSENTTCSVHLNKRTSCNIKHACGKEGEGCCCCCWLGGKVCYIDDGVVEEIARRKGGNQNKGAEMCAWAESAILHYVETVEVECAEKWEKAKSGWNALGALFLFVID